MKKPANEYTDSEIMKRLAFARKIMSAQRQCGLPVALDPDLEQERRELLCEMEARTSSLPLQQSNSQ